MPREKTLDWYEKKIESGKITLEEIDEYQKKIDEQIKAAEENRAALREQRKTANAARAKATREQNKKRAYQIGKALQEQLGYETDTETVNQIVQIAKKAENTNSEYENLKSEVFELYKILHTQNLNDGGTLLNYLANNTDGNLIQTIAYKVGFLKSKPKTQAQENAESEKPAAQNETAENGAQNPAANSNVKQTAAK